MRYPLHGAVRVTLAARSFNTVFRVQAADDSFALRLGATERIHPEGTEEIETRWMLALRAETPLSVSDILNAGDGTPVVRQGHRGVPGERICVLFGWVP